MKASASENEDLAAGVEPATAPTRLLHIDARRPADRAGAASPPPGSDAAIARDVEIGLRWTPAVPPGVIAVTVESGWVTLRGSVGWVFEKRAAVDSLRYLRGVIGLTDRIAVIPPPDSGVTARVTPAATPEGQAESS